MARRRRHHRRHRGFGSIISVPGLGGLKDLNPLGKSVGSTQVLIGAGLGLVGGMGVKYLLNKIDSLPDIIKDNIQIVSAVLAGVAGYAFYRKKNKQKGTALLLGSVIAAAIGPATSLLVKQFPQFADLIQLGGFPVRDGYNGFPVRDSYGELGELAQFGMEATQNAESSYPEM